MQTNEEILRVYSGKIGCMCGCRGKYYNPIDNHSTVVRLSRKIINDPNVKFDPDCQAYVLETNTRNNVVWVKRTVVAN